MCPKILAIKKGNIKDTQSTSGLWPFLLKEENTEQIW